MKGKSKGKSQKAKVKSSAVAGFLLFSAAAFGAPCITATADCTEWLTFGGGPSRSLFYRTYSLEGRHENITRALIVIHGAGRDANNYFRTGVAAAFLDGRSKIPL